MSASGNGNGGGGSATRKRCSNCERLLAMTSFYAHAGRKDGRQSWCKTCVNTYMKGYEAGKRRGAVVLQALRDVKDRIEVVA